MGFREDIPLGDFFQSNPFTSDVFGTTTSSGTGSFTTMTFAIEPPSPDQQIYLSPAVGRSGVQTRSTSLELENWPSVVWDVNGYYCALGVGFRATRKQLLTAYMQLNGQESERLTYIFKQLLDPEVRRKYDACPLGTLFFDRYVEEKLKQQAMKMAKIRDRTPEEILREWGFEIRTPDGEVPVQGEGVQDHQAQDEEVDIPQETGEDEDVSPAEEPDVWPYAYYLWKVRRRDLHLATVETMRQWQEAIVAECERQNVRARFAVGMTSRREENASRLLTMSVDGATVVFISADHLDEIEQLAPYAVHRLLSSEI